MVTPLAAQIGIGDWRAHLHLAKALKAVETPTRVYCGTTNGVFFIDKEDNSVTSLSTVDGLSDVMTHTLAYEPATNHVFVAYSGGMVDMLGPDYVVPIPFIADNANISGDKTVVNFFFYSGLAYMATAFGVVVYDIEKREVRESYLNLDERGNQLAVNDVVVFQNRVFVATKNGIRSGSLNDNLLDFNFWVTTHPSPCSLMEVFDNRLILYFANDSLLEYDGGTYSPYGPLPKATVRQMDVQNGKLVVTKWNHISILSSDGQHDSVLTNAPSHGMLDHEGTMWVSSMSNGLIKFSETRRYFTPNGPGGPTAWDFDYSKGELWVASGGVDLAYNPRFLNNGAYVFADNKWQNLHGGNTPALSPLRDIHQVRIDEVRGTKYLASFNKGVAMISDNEVQVFGKDNTDGALAPAGGGTDPDALVLVSGIDLDTQGNLWMGVQYAENSLAVRTANGTWKSFFLGPDNRVTRLLVDESGQKWLIVHLDGIYVFNDGGTPLNESDDKVKHINTSVGNGNLPAPDVYCMALDLDGNIWLGTGEGVCVVYNPDNVFEANASFDATRPIVTDGDVSAYLLEGQKVNCIAVDGANQKWLGTNNGVFVTNSNGDEVLYRFTVDNSPLLSNMVYAIGIDGKTGEAFFATSKGLVSYRAQATLGDSLQQQVYVFPNPVRPGYTGPIAITGLTPNANVKITDISGNLVYETNAQGGTAVWYGKDFSGMSVSSGVYLAFSANRNGEQTHITKIMVVR
ncbi:MAG: hypothetical protein HYZ16_09990 [Bacteroidetes bacterium]|nr:hypothetical protein [Bacteroidota bacterium]